MNFSFKKNVIMIIIAALLALGVGGAAVAIGVSSMPANRISRYMGAAERYLSEMNYEQAIIEFQKILEIEPMNEDAIIGLADAYAGIGNREKAIEVLNNGFELTGATRIERRLNKLQEPTTSLNGGDSNSTSNQPAQTSSLSESQSGMTGSSSEPEMRDVHPESEYDDLVFVGDYGYTSVFGSYDDPYGGKDHFYAVKKVSGGVIELKESNYPIFVSDDGIITYYGYKDNESVQVIIETEQGKVISETTIQGNTDQLYIGFGACVDRIRRAFKQCDFAFFEGDDCTYIFGKDGSVKDTKSLNVPSVSYWAPYIEGVGTLTYVHGYGNDGDYFYLPDLDEIYRDEFPAKIVENGIELKKNQPTWKNYGSVIIYSYCDSNAEVFLDGSVSPDSTYYVLANFSTQKITKAYKNIETTDGKVFKATNLNGKTVYIDASGNEIVRSNLTSSSSTVSTSSS